MMQIVGLRAWAVLVVICWAQISEGIWLDLPSTGTKCVSEEIQNNVVVLGDYVVVPMEDHAKRDVSMSVRVTSPFGNNLYHIENATIGQFAFTTTEAGSYLACFWLDSHHQGSTGISVNLEWRIGIAAKDWDTVAKKEKIEGVELELRKLESHVKTIHDNLIYLKQREANMREVSESTNSRVAWFSIMSLGVCIVVSVVQVFYLKRYFRKKKLI